MAAVRDTRPAAGFSLIEALVAVTLLLLTCAAVSGVLIAAAHGSARLSRYDDLEQALDGEVQRLRALPFFAPAAAAGVLAGEADPPSLLAVLFPHALSGRNSTDARYCPDEQPARFVRTQQRPWGTLRTEAWFVTRAQDEWAPLDAPALTGWAIWQAAWPPAAAVMASIAAIADDGRMVRERTIVFRGLEPRLAATESGGEVR